MSEACPDLMEGREHGMKILRNQELIVLRGMASYAPTTATLGENHEEV